MPDAPNNDPDLLNKIILPISESSEDADEFTQKDRLDFVRLRDPRKVLGHNTFRLAEIWIGFVIFAVILGSFWISTAVLVALVSGTSIALIGLCKVILQDLYPGHGPDANRANLFS